MTRRRKITPQEAAISATLRANLEADVERLLNAEMKRQVARAIRGKKEPGEPEWKMTINWKRGVVDERFQAESEAAEEAGQAGGNNELVIPASSASRRR